MANTKYTYSIHDDFPNQVVSPSALSEQIKKSSISSSILLYINTFNDGCDIWFNDALSVSDKTDLDAVVAAHDGTPLPISDWNSIVPDEPYLEQEYQSNKLVRQAKYATLEGDGRFSMPMEERTYDYSRNVLTRETVTTYDPLGFVVSIVVFGWKVEKFGKSEIRRRYKVES